jgi:sugar phosphate isomerase/epimerase
MHLTRRGFLQGAVAAGAAAAAGRTTEGQTLPVRMKLQPAIVRADAVRQNAPWKVGGFTKELQDLSPEDTARVATELSWDGIELPVRAKGHVLPERVDEDLPKMAAALKTRNLDLMVLATDVRGVDPLSERVLRAAAKVGARRYRLGALRYRDTAPIPQQLDNFRAQLKDLAALNRQLGLTGLLQNHSGNGYVGAALWDAYDLMKDFSPQDLGIHFDIGHATVELGQSWPTAFSLVKDRIGAVIVKDFYWQHTPGKGARVTWCPVGQGSIQPRFFAMLRASGFQGPLMLQWEYGFPDSSLPARMRVLRADTDQLRAWLKA